MNDRERSKLSYLAQAIAADPEMHHGYFDLLKQPRIQRLIRPASPELQTALDALQSVLEKRVRGKRVSKSTLVRAASELKASPDVSVRVAGSSLEWAAISCAKS